MDKIERIKSLTDELNHYRDSYYNKSKSIVSDKKYDELYDELEQLEKETGVIFGNSPTQTVGYDPAVLELKKVQHLKPMLSAKKTKNTDEIAQFIKNNCRNYSTMGKWYCSYKLDGLTLVVIYKHGKFVQGITRGNGTIGEDVTEQCRYISNLPMQLPEDIDLELRGECVISWDEFNRINDGLKEPYLHPRNLAAGTLRCLDLNIVKSRKLSFVVFEVINGWNLSKTVNLSDTHKKYGFETVRYFCSTKNDIYDDMDYMVEKMKPEDYPYPVDGLVFEINSIPLSESLGATSHHENCRMALKWADNTQETILRDVLWQTSKTGRINPVAIFDKIDLDGAFTTRATLHNIDFIKNLQLGIGDTITVYRSNMVIPAIDENLTCSDNLKIPDTCPTCGGQAIIARDGDSSYLWCTNPNCSAKLAKKIQHFCSRDAINVEGMSQKTIEKFVSLGFLNSYADLYQLNRYRSDIIKLDGFGAKSVDKMLENINKSKDTTLARFLNALSIPNIGTATSKLIASSIEEEYKKLDVKYNILNFLINTISNKGRNFLSKIPNLGDVLINSTISYFKDNLEEIKELSCIFYFHVEESTKIEQELQGLTFVITGSLYSYKNREELSKFIEEHGGKVTGSVSKSTSYLINNDIESNSSKNKKAKSLNIPIITEENFKELFEKMGNNNMEVIKS